MSMRSTLLSTARAARHALPKAQIAPRRAASSASHGSSNMPWALGSAAVFGSLTAFILMPSGDKAAHVVHENIDAKGAGAHVADGSSTPEHEDEHHDKARDLMRKERESGDRPTLDENPKDKPVHEGENRPRTEIPSKRDDQKPLRGASTGSKFDGTIDKNAEGDFAATRTDGPTQKESSSYGGKPAGDKAAESAEKAKDAASSAVDKAKDSASSAVDKAKDSAGSVLDKAKDAAESAKGSAGSVVDKAKDAAESAKDAAGSLADKAKATAGSAVGQAKEAVGGGSSSPKSTPSSSSGGSSTPSNVDDSDKPSDSEIKDSIKQAERSNSPLATMAEEVDESASTRKV